MKHKMMGLLSCRGGLFTLKSLVMSAENGRVGEREKKRTSNAFVSSKCQEPQFCFSIEQ